jgi:hypothetical protein
MKLTDQPRDASASREMNMAEDRNGFWLLAAGALAFALAFVLGIDWLHLDQVAEGPVTAAALIALGTLLFGLPYALREVLRRETNWLLVAFLLILIPVFHAVGAGAFYYVSDAIAKAALRAAEAAAASTDPEAMMQAAPEGSTTPRMLMGLAAGFAGALGPMLALALMRRLRAAAASPWLLVGAVIALAWWGGMGMRLATFEITYDMAVTLFLPWQILLAFFLSLLLRPSPPKGAVPQ